MDIINIVVRLLGGLCMFLFGMKAMGDGLEKVAGTKMQKIVESLTGNIFKGVLVGTAVTAIIQSSSATTVMVVGFVSAGVMTLKQAVGVIMGANIGTTVTALILCLNGVEASSGILAFLKPDFLMYVVIIIGVLMIFVMKKQKHKDIGGILFGLGILFVGMSEMTASMKNVDTNYFVKAFTMFANNPFLGVITGAVITALIQSSAASLGVLLALSATGIVSFGGAIPIILGQNIGTCITAILSSISANKNAKKAAILHLMFNIIGTILCLVVVYSLKALIPAFMGFWNMQMTNWNIAIFHLIFNVSNTCILLPFAGLMVKMVNIIVKNDNKPTETDKVVAKLDDRFLHSPSIAINQAKSALHDMFYDALSNVKDSCEAIISRSEDKIKIVEEKEKVIDSLEVLISQYLIKIADKEVNETESKTVSGYMHIITDIERIGDYAKNLTEYAHEMIIRDKDFSEKAKDELRSMFDACYEIVECTMQTLDNNDKNGVRKVQPYEEVIDLFTETLKIKHINRLATRNCTAEIGILYVEIINNIERIADHCNNIAVSVHQINSSDKKFDPHEYMKKLKHTNSDDYQTYFKEFQDKYYTPIM